MPDSLLGYAGALVVGSLIGALLYEGVAGNESFSPPFLNIILVVLIGSVASAYWGWTAVSWVLGVYAVYCVGGGLWDRRSGRRS